MIYRTGLLTTSFEHVLKACIKERKLGISYILAQRNWDEGGERKTYPDVPYLNFKRVTQCRFEINKQSAVPIPIPEWIRILNVIKEVGAIDLTVINIGFLVDGKELFGDLKEIKNAMDKRVIILFYRNHLSAKEPAVREGLIEILGEKVSNLNLNYSTLDLTGIYFYSDKEKKINLLDKVDGDKDRLREIMDDFFYENVAINGDEIKKIRFVKCYDESTKNIMSLWEFTRF